jgi:hypothetical protein
MGKPNGVKHEFASVLREALKDIRGRVPSAAAVAREFNLRASGIEPVTQESVRRWLRGISMPEEQKLAILVSWLNLDLTTAMKRAHEIQLNSKNGNGHSGNGVTRPNPAKSLIDDIDPSTLDQARQIARLPPADQALVKDFIDRLLQKSQPQGHSAIKTWPEHAGH